MTIEKVCEDLESHISELRNSDIVLLFNKIFKEESIKEILEESFREDVIRFILDEAEENEKVAKFLYKRFFGENIIIDDENTEEYDDEEEN